MYAFHAVKVSPHTKASISSSFIMDQYENSTTTNRHEHHDEEESIIMADQVCNIIPDKGESKEEDAQRGKSDTAHDESHLAAQQQQQPQHFMESMIQQYTSLVEDLSRELFECQEYIKLHIDSEQKEECKSETRSGGQVEGDHVEGEDVCSLKEQIHRKDAMIDNLQKQLEISHKTSNINKSLWQSAIRNIETLESQKSQMEMAARLSRSRRQRKQPAEEDEEMREPSGIINGCQHVSSLPSDFLSKWKLLQSYSESLENRLAKSANERNFYRSKMMEIRLEYETALKRQAVEKSREVELVKASYAKEIEYLKTCVERLRSQNKADWEKRLEAEKETWEYGEHKRLQSLKIHVENLIMENELLRQKQLQLDSLSRSMNISNVANAHANNVSHAEVQCNFNGSNGDRRFKSVQTELNGAAIASSTDQVNRLKTSQHQLELEYKRILVQLDFTEATAQTKSSNLEERIRELESLNAHLHNQIMGLNESNAKLVSQTSQRDERLVSPSSSSVPRTETQQQEQLPQVPLITEPSWRQPDDSLIHEKYRVDRSMWQLQLSRMQEEIQRLEEERAELFSLVDQQQAITNKWKAEVKELVKQSIKHITNKR